MSPPLVGTFPHCEIDLPLPPQWLCDVHLVWPPRGDLSLLLLSLQQVVVFLSLSMVGPVDHIQMQGWIDQHCPQVPRGININPIRCLVAGESRHSLTGPPSCTCRWHSLPPAPAGANHPVAKRKTWWYSNFSRSIACQGVRHNFVGFQVTFLRQAK